MNCSDVTRNSPTNLRNNCAFRCRKAAVDRICSFVEARAKIAPSVSELCEEVNMSRRSLQYCFNDVLGVSPKQFLKVYRLNNVRRQLISGLDESETIFSIASTWGFNHAGQFSVDYKKLFGESPSQTLNQKFSVSSSSHQCF